MKNSFFVYLIVFISCTNKKIDIKPGDVPVSKSGRDSTHSLHIADAATILARKQVPVLCYHHIRNTRPGDYVVSPKVFAEQMQALEDSGYQTILPDQLYNYLATGASLPVKPVMLSFDDTDLEQFTIGATEMSKHNFKGVFFIMTISIGRRRYISKEQIRELSDDGNAIEAHTWDHHKVTEYTDEDWDEQLNQARQKLETITGKPVIYFAYPFGLWDTAAISQLHHRGIKMAFQLSARRDSLQPLYTVRRMLVPGTLTTKGLFRTMKSTFR